MTTENRFILDLILCSAEEELKRDLRIKLRQFLDQAMNQAASRKMGRTPQCQEQAVVDSNAERFPSQRIENLHEESTRKGPSSRGPRQVIAELQGGTRDTAKRRNPVSYKLEEGEIRQDPELQHWTLQWEQFTELKNQMSSVANPASREEQLRQLCKLEHQIAQAISYASSSKVVEEQIEKQVGISLRGVKREADRMVEGSLLRCKAEVYAKLWKGLKDALTQCQHVTGLQGM